MRLNNNKGFTLIEVVVAFAVLAIVSGSLLQMFVTSTKVNQKTYNKDKANTLAIKLLEEFKATPEDTYVALFPELSGATRTVSGSGINYFQYLGQNWTVSNITSYAYTLEVQTTDTGSVDNGEMSFYTEPVHTLEFVPLSGVMNYTLEAYNPVDATHPAPDGNQTELSFQDNNGVSMSANVYGNVKDGKVAVFIKSNPPMTTSTAITVCIKNKAKLTLADDGSYDPAGTPKDFQLDVYFINIPETQVTFNSGFEGLSSYSFVDGSVVNTHFKTMKVKVTSRSDGAVITDQQTGKYIVTRQ